MTDTTAVSLTATSFGHSTVRLEREGESIVIDPGTLAPAAAFAGVSAFLVTHNHQDHVDVSRLAAALATDPAVHAWVSSEIAAELTDAGTAEDQISIVSGNDVFDAAGFTVKAMIGEHAEIYHALPPSENIAYLIDGRILHPGDAFPTVGAHDVVEVLFLPVNGPWMRFADAADYVAQLRPRVIIPIHDGDLIDMGRQLTDQMSGLFPGDGTYRRLPVGEPVPL